MALMTRTMPAIGVGGRIPPPIIVPEPPVVIVPEPEPEPPVVQPEPPVKCKGVLVEVTIGGKVVYSERHKCDQA